MRLFGIVFHNLKGSPGWSSLDLVKIDVGRIMNTTWKKRTFMITDKNKPYTLTLSYFEPVNKRFRPILTTQGFGFSLYNTAENEHLITKRYETKSEIESEVSQIKHKQKQLDLFKDEFIKKF